MEFGVSRAGSPGPTHTENPLGTLSRRDSSDQKKPEVVVTKAKRKIPSPSPSPRDDVSGSRATAFMNLLPAPTPTRFIGMMHKVKQEIDKKKPEAGGSRSKPSSRRSSIVPTQKTIDEDNEGESTTSTPRKQETVAGGGGTSSGFATALRMVGKTKIDQAKLKGLGGSSRKDSVKSDAASTTSTSPSNAGTPLKSKGGASPVSPSPGKRSGGSGAKKAATGLAAFKKGAGFAKKKKEVSAEEADVGGSKEMKLRLFFKERNEQTDEEVLANIGREVIPKEISQGMNEIVNAASMIKKLMKEKEQASIPAVEVAASTKDHSTSLTYAGTLKNRLSSSSRSTSRVTSNNAVDIAHHATHFLGKIMARKDRHGLYVGSPQSSLEKLEKEQGKHLDNPVITALEKVRLRPQGSTDSGESRASRASAAGSPAGSGAPGGAGVEEPVVGKF